jgi:hypothetical protein
MQWRQYAVPSFQIMAPMWLRSYGQLILAQQL